MQGQKVADIYAKFGLDDTALNTGLKKADKNIIDMHKTVSKLGKTIAGAFAIKHIVDFGRESIKLASDLKELDNVIDKTFKKSANTVRAYADTYAKSVGRSKIATRELTSFYGNMLKSQGLTNEELVGMSQNLTQLTFDMASFKNIRDDVARTALKGVITGETESIKEQGIVITELNLKNFTLERGYSKLYDKMTPLEKLQTRYNYVLEKTAFYQNDARDTIESTANQTKRFSSLMADLKTNMGFLLEPAYNTALTGINNSMSTLVDTTDRQIQKIKDLREEFKLGAIAFSGVFEDIQGTQRSYKAFEDFIKKYKKQIKALGLDPREALKKAEVASMFGGGSEQEVEVTVRKFLDEIFLKINEPSSMIWDGKDVEEEQQKIQTATDKFKENMNGVEKALSEIESLGDIKEQNIKDIIMEKIAFLDTELTEIFSDSKYSDEFKNYLANKRQNLNEELKLIEETEDNAKRENDINAKKRETKEKIAATLELEKKSLKAEEELEKAKREMYYEGLNENLKIKKLFEGMSLEQLEKYLSISKEAGDFDFVVVLEDLIDKTKDSNKENVNYSKTLSDVATITSELSTLFGDDLLGAMGTLMNQGANMMSSWSTAGALGQAGMVIQGVSMIKGIVDSFDDDDRDRRRAEDNKVFEEAVNKFQKAVNDMSIGQKISFAQLERPEDLGGYFAGSGKAGTGGDLGSLIISGGLSGLFGGKKKDASLDVSGLQKQLEQAGYGDINAEAVFRKYAQYGSYRSWGRKKSYISGYDTEGAMAEIQRLIDDAWQQNLDNFKGAVGLMSSDFSSQFASIFKKGGDAKTALDAMLRDSFSKSVFYSEAFEKLGDQLGDKFSDIIFDEVDLNIGDVSGMSFEEAYETMLKLYEDTTGNLNDEFEKLGIAVGDVTKEMDSLTASTENLPSFLRIAPAITQSSMNTDNRQTIVNIENNYSDEFPDKVMNIINRNNYVSTGNLMGGYR